MYRQIRATVLILCLLSAAVVLTACGKQEKTATEQPVLETVEYSNLTDEDSRKQLSELLSDSGIEESRIAALLNRVEQFNASVKSEWLTDGFESAAPTDTKYDPYDMQDEWAAANGSFPGYNCRITAFGLFSEFITAGADQPETQAKALQEGWTARGIVFADSRASMISVVFHDKFSDEDNTLFIGHVGVLLPAEDGTMYFIEKVAFQEPYRLVKLQNRTELSDYLMEKYDTSWGQDTTHPFIMENDTLMDGYRPNPLEETNP